MSKEEQNKEEVIQGNVWIEILHIDQRNLELSKELDKLMEKLKPIMNNIDNVSGPTLDLKYECSIAQDLYRHANTIKENIDKLRIIQSKLQI